MHLFVTQLKHNCVGVQLQLFEIGYLVIHISKRMESTTDFLGQKKFFDFQICSKYD